MKLLVAGRDRTGDVGAEIRSFAAGRGSGCGPRFVSPEIGALCLCAASSEEDYLRELIRLIRHRDAFDTLDFDVPRRPGLIGRFMAGFKTILRKLMRFQFERTAFQQNLINRMFTTAIECEVGLREREMREMKSRIVELESRR